MYLNATTKKDLFKKNSASKTAADTGSAESQIGLFTFRINHLTDHLKVHKKDFSTRLGLLKLVRKRRRLLNYLAENDLDRYRKILAELNIRK